MSSRASQLSALFETVGTNVIGLGAVVLVLYGSIATLAIWGLGSLTALYAAIGMWGSLVPSDATQSGMPSNAIRIMSALSTLVAVAIGVAIVWRYLHAG